MNKVTSITLSHLKCHHLCVFSFVTTCCYIKLSTIASVLRTYSTVYSNPCLLLIPSIPRQETSLPCHNSYLVFPVTSGGFCSRAAPRRPCKRRRWRDPGAAASPPCSGSEQSPCPSLFRQRICISDLKSTPEEYFGFSSIAIC
jgi:hypothetical protein